MDYSQEGFIEGVTELARTLSPAAGAHVVRATSLRLHHVLRGLPGPKAPCDARWQGRIRTPAPRTPDPASGHRPAHYAISRADVQRRWAPTALRPSRSFRGAFPSLECRRSAKCGCGYSDVCCGWIAVVLPQRVAGPTAAHFVVRRPTSALGGDRRFRHWAMLP
jgi:hypothetical protein